MSWRQPTPRSNVKSETAENAKIAEKLCPDSFSASFAISTVPFLTASVRNSGYLPRTERLEKPSRRFEIELRIARFDAQEEAVSAREREPCHVEYRMVRLRQAVQGQHAEHR